MSKGEDLPSDMAHARQSDGINVVFDQNSPPSSRSRSNSGGSRGRGSNKRRYRSSSSSSSSSSRSSSHSRSRSHPRCHRRSSRCGCLSHRRHGRGHYRRSPARRSRAHSRSYRKAESRLGSHISQSPSRTYRSRSRSRSSGRSTSLSLDDKRELLKAAQTRAMEVLGVEKVELPESVKPNLPEQPESGWVSLEPQRRVRQDPEKTLSQSSEMESDDEASPKMSPKRRIITFSINNSVAKPTLAAPSSAKVTPRVDSYESRKPYGHWVPVKSVRTSKTRKHTLATSH
ncbi:arginine/serine-rich protein 1 [Pempheris klunzingeri]|uniref:arginine/serine-rich protein 1 n=1 Tax=Pempheris klunzingeri TaxID=3127111 RepID=UPI00397ED21A